MRPALRIALALGVLMAVGLARGAAPAQSPVGALSQLAGATGCIVDVEAVRADEDVPADLANACTGGVAFRGAYDAVVSPDGRHVYAAAFDGASLSSFARSSTGALTQLAGSAACIAEPAFELPCAEGTPLDQPSSIAISPDGRSVYVAGFRSHSVVSLARDAATGALTQPPGEAGCVSQLVTEFDCAAAIALLQPIGLAVSPDGRNVYVAAGDSDAVASFARDSGNGRLTQLQGSDACAAERFVEDEDEPLQCAAGVGLENATDVAVSPDGRNVYVVSNAVAVFARSPASGALRQLAGQAACVSDSGSDGSCADGRGLAGPFSVAVSPDGRHVYVASGFDAASDEPLAAGGIAILRRDSRHGALTQLEGQAGCVSANGSGGQCAVGRALLGVQQLTVSSDGRNVYTASAALDAIGAFARSATTGQLTQLPRDAGCTSDSGSEGGCADGRALGGVSTVVVSPDGRNAYAASIYHHSLTSFARSTPPKIGRAHV